MADHGRCHALHPENMDATCSDVHALLDFASSHMVDGGCASVLNVDNALIGQLSPAGRAVGADPSQRAVHQRESRRADGGLPGAPAWSPWVRPSIPWPPPSQIRCRPTDPVTTRRRSRRKTLLFCHAADGHCTSSGAHVRPRRVSTYHTEHVPCVRAHGKTAHEHDHRYRHIPCDGTSRRCSREQFGATVGGRDVESW